MQIRIKVIGGFEKDKNETLLKLVKFIEREYKIKSSGGIKGFDTDEREFFESWRARIQRREGDMNSNFNKDTTREDIDALLTERGKTHGDYERHAVITQEIKDVMHRTIGAKHTLVHRESLEMIAHKIGRILVGDPDFRDHWDDIAGYAKLAADRCSK